MKQISQFKKFYLEFISKPLKSSIPFILLLIGVIAYVSSFFINEGSIYQKIIFDFAELMIVSFFVTLVTNTYMFINIFRNTMEGIVSDASYLENRKDIFNIWTKASKVLLKSKFPEISDDLLNLINEAYFPNDDGKYYSNYTYSVTIKWVDKEKNHIRVEQELSYDLNCVSKDKVELKSKSWTKIDPLMQEPQSIEYSETKVNNLPATIVNTEKYVDKNSLDTVIVQTIELSGASKYLVSKEIHKIMDIDYDPYLGFRPQFMLNKLRVQIFKPEDLGITFVERGTINEFNKVKNNKDYMEFQYNGLLLPNQGFILILQNVQIKTK